MEEGKRKERRSKTLDDAPAFGDALADGAIGAEHVDALADATSKLDDDVKASLLDEAPDLLGAATTMSLERFGRHLRDRARRLERDNGIERNARQRRETFLSRKLNGATGRSSSPSRTAPSLGEPGPTWLNRSARPTAAEEPQREARRRRISRSRPNAHPAPG